MVYILSFLAGAIVLAAGVLIVVVKDNWSEGLTWRGKSRHEGRQS